MMLQSALFLLSAALAMASPASAKYEVPEVTEEDIKTFNYLAEHSAASYCNTLKQHVNRPVTCANDACPILSSHNTTILGVFDGDFMGFRAYTAVDHDEKEIVLAVRSVDEPKMWATVSNFTIWEWPLVDQAQAHKQFIDPWNTMDPDAVTPFGGSIATLAAAQLRLEHNFPIDVYTFGAPRLGNDHLSRFIEEQEEGKVYRVTHRDDYISRLPRPDKGYRHISNEYWLNGKNATDDTYPVEDVQVCEGMLNFECNAGTDGYDFDTHFTYFGNIRGCI